MGAWCVMHAGDTMQVWEGVCSKPSLGPSWALHLLLFPEVSAGRVLSTNFLVTCIRIIYCKQLDLLTELFKDSIPSPSKGPVLPCAHLPRACAASCPLPSCSPAEPCQPQHSHGLFAQGKQRGTGSPAFAYAHFLPGLIHFSSQEEGGGLGPQWVKGDVSWPHSWVQAAGFLWGGCSKAPLE